MPALSARVIDQTGTLTPAQVAALDAKLQALETQRGAQLVVLMVPTTAPEDIAAYAQRIADTWKIGRREIGDGLLIVVAKNDRTVRIEVAKALEGAVPDAAAGRIIDEQIVPAFKAGDFAGGTQRRASTGWRPGSPARGWPRRSRESAGPARTRGFDLQDLALFLFVGVPVVGAVLTGIFGRKLGSLVTGGAVGAIGWWLTASAARGCGRRAASPCFLVGVMGVGGGRRRVAWAARSSGAAAAASVGAAAASAAAVASVRAAVATSVAAARRDGGDGKPLAPYPAPPPRRRARRAAARLAAGALQRIEARVAASELHHSGEIRVCVESGLPLSYLLPRCQRA